MLMMMTTTICTIIMELVWKSYENHIVLMTTAIQLYRQSAAAILSDLLNRKRQSNDSSSATNVSDGSHDMRSHCNLRVAFIGWDFLTLILTVCSLQAYLLSCQFLSLFWRMKAVACGWTVVSVLDQLVRQSRCTNIIHIHILYDANVGLLVGESDKAISKIKANSENFLCQKKAYVLAVAISKKFRNRT